MTGELSFEFDAPDFDAPEFDAPEFAECEDAECDAAAGDDAPEALHVTRRLPRERVTIRERFEAFDANNSVNRGNYATLS